MSRDALAHAIVGVLFKHDPMMTLSSAMQVADEIASRLVVDEYVELGHTGTMSDLFKTRSATVSGYYGDYYRLSEFGSDKIVESLRLKEVS